MLEEHEQLPVFASSSDPIDMELMISAFGLRQSSRWIAQKNSKMMGRH